MPSIVRASAREILDSRGRPTVEAEVYLDRGQVGRASVPSGASTGAAEAHELRDGDPARYDGLGVLRPVKHVIETVSPAIAGLNPADQETLDQRLIALDGTPNKSRLGANALLAVSLAAARAAAASLDLPLYQHLSDLLGGGSPRMPLPMVNMISGAKHAGGNLDIQDVLILPVGAPSYAVGLEWIVRVYRRLGKLLAAAGYEGYLVGDEGGYGPRLRSNREALECVVRAIEAAGLAPGREVALALDIAATHFFHAGGYRLARDEDRELTSSQLVDRLEAWTREFPIVSIEDGLAENDWTGWRELTERLGARVALVGDDLFATNAERLLHGVTQGVANAVLIKVNQIGTLTETLRTVRLAKKHGYRCVVSARSGETEDDFLADLAVGVAGEQIKVGSVARSERLAKYNRLLRIAEELGDRR
jgi:enolase